MTAAPAAVAGAWSRTAAVVVDSKTVDIRRRRRRRMTEMNSCPVSAAAAAGPAGPDRDRACSSWPLALRDAEWSSSLSIRYMSRRRGAQAGAILLHGMALSLLLGSSLLLRAPAPGFSCVRASPRFVGPCRLAIRDSVSFDLLASCLVDF